MDKLLSMKAPMIQCLSMVPALHSGNENNRIERQEGKFPERSKRGVSLLQIS